MFQSPTDPASQFLYKLEFCKQSCIVLSSVCNGDDQAVFSKFAFYEVTLN